MISVFERTFIRSAAVTFTKLTNILFIPLNHHMLQPDILLRRYRNSLTRLLLPGHEKENVSTLYPYAASLISNTSNRQLLPDLEGNFQFATALFSF